jgi:hypothetical protein
MRFAEPAKDGAVNNDSRLESVIAAKDVRDIGKAMGGTAQPPTSGRAARPGGERGIAAPEDSEESAPAGAPAVVKAQKLADVERKSASKGASQPGEYAAQPVPAAEPFAQGPADGASEVTEEFKPGLRNLDSDFVDSTAGVKDEEGEEEALQIVRHRLRGARENSTEGLAGDVARNVRPENLWLFALASSPSVHQKYIASNSISAIEASHREGQPERQMAVSSFHDRALAAFNELVTDFGGKINRSEEVTLLPRNRTGIWVECEVPLANGDDLLQAVNNKRMVAFAAPPGEQLSQQLDSISREINGRTFAFGARALDANGQQAGVKALPPVRRVTEYELANSTTPILTNFYVQNAPVGANNTYLAQRFARSTGRSEYRARVDGAQMSSAGQTFRGALPTTQPEQAIELNDMVVANGVVRYSGTSGTTLILTPARQPLGANRRFYFVLEPDQSIPSAAQIDLPANVNAAREERQ